MRMKDSANTLLTSLKKLHIFYSIFHTYNYFLSNRGCLIFNTIALNG